MSQIRRQALRNGLGATAGVMAASGCGLPSSAFRRAPKLHRVGYLALNDDPTTGTQVAFRQGLRDLGYVEGQNVLVEYRFAGGKPERLPALAAELVAVPVEVILAVSSDPTAAAQRVTATVPIVAPQSGGRVAGFVTNLTHPEGNITGLSGDAVDTIAKRVQLLKAAVPAITRAAVLWNPTNAGKPPELKEAQAAAPQVGLQLASVEIRDLADLDAAFAGIRVQEPAPQALVVLSDGVTLNTRQRLAEFALEQGLPTVDETRDFVQAGGLMSYGVNRPAVFRRAAAYVDKILKGAKPSDLPVELPTKFDFVVNLKTAQALGLSLPQSVLTQATEVIR